MRVGGRRALYMVKRVWKNGDLVRKIKYKCMGNWGIYRGKITIYTYGIEWKVKGNNKIGWGK
jgi:hypothetical protein